jgi:hypothetical protein
MNKFGIFISVSAIATAVFAQGKIWISFNSFPPEIEFPETSLLWRALIIAAGIWMLIASIKNSNEE